jgi:sugar (pentulose or hexulose) kinase
LSTSHSSHQGKDLYLGIDLGTSGIRAILLDEHEHLIAAARTPLPPPRQEGPAVEQDPALWWSGVEKIMQDLHQQVGLHTLRAIAVDGTSGTLLLTDAQGQPLHAALMYNDSRARDQLQTLQALAPAESPVHSASSGLAKLLWLSAQPYAAQARHALHQADWIAGKLAGRFGFSDPNNSLKTGYDARHNRWPIWLEQLPRLPNWLPTVYPQATPVCGIDPAIADRFGLSPQVQIIAGTTDRPRFHLGAENHRRHPGDRYALRHLQSATGPTLVGRWRLQQRRRRITALLQYCRDDPAGIPPQA